MWLNVSCDRIYACQFFAFTNFDYFPNFSKTYIALWRIVLKRYEQTTQFYMWQPNMPYINVPLHFHQLRFLSNIITWIFRLLILRHSRANATLCEFVPLVFLTHNFLTFICPLVVTNKMLSNEFHLKYYLHLFKVSFITFKRIALFYNS